jgi:hypothetical protein
VLRFFLELIVRFILTLLLVPIVLPLLKVVGLDSSWLVPHIGPPPAAAAVQALGPPRPELQAVLVWLAITLALPLVTMDLLRGVVRKGSNALNACIVLIYVAIDLLLATTAFPLATGWTSTLTWSAVAALSLAYSIVTMNLALYLET